MNLSTHKKSEVDLRVAQELKNHSDFVYQTNQTLQKLAMNIDQFHEQVSRILQKSEAEKKDILISFENFSEKIEKHCTDLENRISNHEAEVFQSIKMLSTALQYLDKDSVKMTVFDRKTTCLSENLQNVIDMMMKLVEEQSSSVKRIYNRLREEVDLVRKDLTPAPVTEDPIKKQIDEFRKILKVDLDGIVKEIAILKKCYEYNEKKFENIYTLIDRLKAGINVTSR